MVVYCVYKASFCTRRGTRRHYVGMSGDSLNRERDLQTAGPRQPAWLKAGHSDFSFEVVLDNIQSKAAALATEALVTAHQWRQTPLVTRGGPWVRPSLSAADVLEIEKAARCDNLRDLLALPEAKGSGHLGAHLADLSFTSASSSSAQAPVGGQARGQRGRGASGKGRGRGFRSLRLPSQKDLGAVRKTRKSGGKSLSGHKKRQQAGLEYGSAAFRQAKWGKRPDEARSRHWKTYKPMRKIMKKKPAGRRNL